MNFRITQNTKADANRELITRFEKKIQATRACIWAEEISLREAMGV